MGKIENEKIDSLIETVERARRLLFGVKGGRVGRNDWANLNEVIKILQDIKDDNN